MAQTVPLFLLCLALRAAAVLRWGYVGCGSVTETKSPPSAFRHSGVSDVLAVSRRNATLAASFASRHGVARHYGSPAALVSDPDVTAVYVATPPGSHLEVARLVASVGKASVGKKNPWLELSESLERLQKLSVERTCLSLLPTIGDRILASKDCNE